MAETLGVVSGIAGVVSIAITVCQGLVQFYGSYRDRDDHVETTYSALANLQKTLDLINKNITGGTYCEEATELIKNSIGSCKVLIRKLEKKLDKVKRTNELDLRSKLLNHGRRALYPFTKSTLLKIQVHISKIQENLQLVLGQLEIVAIECQSEKLDNINDLVYGIHENVQSIEDSNTTAQRQRIVQWLSNLSFETKQNDTLERCHKGTGQWIIDHKLFQSWVNTGPSCLWGQGIPGAGKTFLVSIIIDYLKQKVVKKGNVGLAYLYCNYQDRTHTALNLLSAILAQLVQQQPEISSEISNMYKHSQGSTRLSLGAVTTQLSQEMKNFKDIYIVVDALDECANEDDENTRDTFICELQKLHKAHILITSRKITGSDRGFKKLEVIEIRAKDDDIYKYLRDHIADPRQQRLKRIIKKDTALEGEILKTIAEKANGMFLLARLHMGSLSKTLTKRDIRASLRGLPKRLDDKYDEIIERLRDEEDEDSEIVLQILSWITLAPRPLSVLEVQQAVAIEPGNTEVDEENVIDRDNLVELCGGLVTIGSEDLMHLFHYTVQEYLQKRKESLFPNAQTRITSACVTYLSMHAFSSGQCRSEDALDLREKEHSLLNYAAHYWGYHAKGDPEMAARDDILAFLNNEKNIEAYQQVRTRWDKFSAFLRNLHGDASNQKFVKNFTALHVAAELGLSHIAEAFLPGPWLNSIDSFGRTPLCVAAAAGQLDIVRLLLGKGAGVNVAGAEEESVTPLEAASTSGHVEIVKLLLEKEANVHHIHSRKTALEIASSLGHEQIVQLLLERDLTIEFRQGKFFALEMASYYGHEKIVRILLNFAECHSVDYETERALHWACLGGQEKIVQLLLENGAKVNVQFQYSSSALESALWGIDIPDLSTLNVQDTLDYLVTKPNHNVADRINTFLNSSSYLALKNKGKLTIDIQAMNTTNGEKVWEEKIVAIPSQAASAMDATDDPKYQSISSWDQNRSYAILPESSRNKKTVVMLLENNTAANLDSRQYMCALQAAASLGDKQMVERLLQKGANVNSLGGKFGSALQAACAEGQLDTVQLLLAKGANVNATGGPSGTALQAASYAGYLEIVSLLLEKGADVNACGGEFGRAHEGKHGNALNAASFGSRLDVARLLIKSGANVNAFTETFGTALQIALAKNEDKMVQLLLDNGAGLNMAGGIPGSMLVAASHGGNLDRVRFILENDTEIKKSHSGNIGSIFSAAIFAASRQNHNSVIRLLLDERKQYDPKNDNLLMATSVAAENGNMEIIQMLLETGVDINELNDTPGPVHLAANRGHEQVTQRLLQYGAHIEVKGGVAGTALHAAASGGSTNIVHLLVEYGANINSLSGNFGNPLQIASLVNEEQMVRYLLDHGANVNAQGGLWGHALIGAVWEHHWQIVCMLLDHGANVNARGGGKIQNTLQAAAYFGDEYLVRLLLDHGAIVDAGWGAFGSALQAASAGGHYHIVQLLLEEGDVNFQGGLFETSVQAASWAGSEQIIDLLFQNGARLDSEGKSFADAMQIASVSDPTEFLLTWLDGKSAAILPGGIFGSALQAASARGRIKPVRLLLDKGADVNIQGGLGLNALSTASTQGYGKIVAELVDAGADVNFAGGTAPIVSASSCGYERVVRHLLSKGADVNIQYSNYRTALQAASEGGHEKVVQLLLEAGAEVNARGPEDRTALHYACISGHTEVLRQLLKHGIDPNAKDLIGHQAISEAAWEGKPENVALLLKHNAECDQKDVFGLTPLFRAQERRHAEIVQLLVNAGANRVCTDRYGREPMASLWRGFCNRCGTGIPEGWILYVCKDCKTVGFVICERCYNDDSTCLRMDHAVTKKRIRKSEDVEFGSEKDL